MKNDIFTVYYHKTPNPFTTHYQNQNRYVGSKAFATLEEATAFASTVQVKYIYNRTGKRVY